MFQVQLLIFTCGILSAFLWIHFKDQCNAHSEPFTTTSLPRIPWPPDLNKQQTHRFIEGISKNRTPVVISDHPLFERNEWNMNDLISYFDAQLRSGPFEFEYKSNVNCPLFEYYEEDLPLIDILEWEPPNNNTKIEGTLQEYWQYIEDQTDFIEQQNESTLYCCDAPNGFEYRSFSTQIFPSDEILRDHYNEWIRYLVPMNEELQTIKIWIGSKGVVTKFHFDASNNFNVQIRGQKLFRLSAPRFHWNLHHFPWLHPQSRKTQLVKDGLFGYKFPINDLSEMSLFDGVVIHEVMLKEGDILYIPPFWDHEVIGMDREIINLNVWSKGIEAALQERGTSYPLPFDAVQKDINSNLTKQSLMAINLRIYIDDLLLGFCSYFQSLDCDTHFVHQTMKTFVESRYHPLFWSYSLEKESIENIQGVCKALDVWKENGYPDTAIPALFDQHRFRKWFTNKIVRERRKFQKYAERLIENELSKVHRDVALIFLTAYFEIITEYVLGIDAVFQFFDSCF